MVVRMTTRRMTAQQALRKFASEVASRANTLVAKGRPREEVARWVGEVQWACAQRVEEHLGATELSKDTGAARAFPQ
jgi:hypothetical protein